MKQQKQLTQMKFKIRNNKGITLNSLIIYIVGMLIAIAIVATVTKYFSKNVRIEDMRDTTAEYTKFSSTFSEEVNERGNTVLDCKTTGQGKEKVSYIIFSSRKSIYIYGRRQLCI